MPLRLRFHRDDTKNTNHGQKKLMYYALLTLISSTFERHNLENKKARHELSFIIHVFTIHISDK